MNNNYYPSYYPPQPDQFNKQIAEYQRLLSQMQQQSPSMSNRGAYIYVNDYQEVVNYPTSADGNATLFVNLEKGILWSKKFVDGKNCIQAYFISPINDFNPQTSKSTTQEEIAVKPKENNEIMEIMERFGKRLDSIEEKLAKKTVKKVETNAD